MSRLESEIKSLKMALKRFRMSRVRPGYAPALTSDGDSENEAQQEQERLLTLDGCANQVLVSAESMYSESTDGGSVVDNLDVSVEPGPNVMTWLNSTCDFGQAVNSPPSGDYLGTSDSESFVNMEFDISSKEVLGIAEELEKGDNSLQKNDFAEAADYFEMGLELAGSLSQEILDRSGLKEVIALAAVFEKQSSGLANYRRSRFQDAYLQLSEGHRRALRLTRPESDSRLDNEDLRALSEKCIPDLRYSACLSSAYGDISKTVESDLEEFIANYDESPGYEVKTCHIFHILAILHAKKESYEAASIVCHKAVHRKSTTYGKRSFSLYESQYVLARIFEARGDHGKLQLVRIRIPQVVRSLLPWEQSLQDVFSLVQPYYQ
ncbi:hypothetical protein EV356DRAFT_281200 [Viridothelium virens]|uniref:Uncharacterized protein n=1 Tax=Viridothelium virens TaxID=1048519 RepID=A0A6A6H2T2_VIRVR|nr:hypothetical protein EV356DRAFT_281200 [Viridothelium virens]